MGEKHTQPFATSWRVFAWIDADYRALPVEQDVASRTKRGAGELWQIDFFFYSAGR